MAKPTGKGVSKHWTPGVEKYYEKLLTTCQAFAERDLIMTIRDLLKYDGRTKEGKRAIAQARLRLATATDKELEEMAELETAIAFSQGLTTSPEKLEDLKKAQAKIREKGIKRSELACQ